MKIPSFITVKLKMPTCVETVVDRLKVVAIILTVGILQFHSASYGYSLQRHNDDGQHLIAAHSICRHGDRNIYTIYPTDPWKSEKYWPGGYYQLTELGKKEHYILGQYLRRRYKSLVGDDERTADKIFVQSTDKPRTIMSAQSSLAGFFSTDDCFDSESIPIHIVQLKDDYILAVEKKCDRFDYLMMKYANTTAYKRLFEENKKLINYVEKHSGFKIRSLTDINDLYDTFLVERLKHFQLPLWSQDVMQSNGPFELLSLQWYITFTATADLKKLRSGFLLNQILNHFTDKIQSASKHNLWMYFAHDITISNMLNSLGVFELQMPPYSSCIFFELYHDNTAPFVQVFYRNNTQTSVPPLHIPNCGTKCPLERWYELYDDILPKKSIDEECALRDGEILSPGGNPESNSL